MGLVIRCRADREEGQHLPPGSPNRRWVAASERITNRRTPTPPAGSDRTTSRTIHTAAKTGSATPRCSVPPMSTGVVPRPEPRTATRSPLAPRRAGQPRSGPIGDHAINGGDRNAPGAVAVFRRLLPCGGSRAIKTGLAETAGIPAHRSRPVQGVGSAGGGGGGGNGQERATGSQL